jgi:hypothetical protein
VSEYCHKFKNMADALDDLGPPVDDRILVLNILRGPNPVSSTSVPSYDATRHSRPS